MRINKKVQDNLKSARKYGNNMQSGAGDKYFEKVCGMFELIESNPYIGKPINGNQTKRRIACDKHMIDWQINKKGQIKISDYDYGGKKKYNISSNSQSKALKDMKATSPKIKKRKNTSGYEFELG